MSLLGCIRVSSFLAIAALGCTPAKHPVNDWSDDEYAVLEEAALDWQLVGGYVTAALARPADLTQRAVELKLIMLCGLTRADRSYIELDRNCCEFQPFGEGNNLHPRGLDGLRRVALHEYGHVLGVKHIDLPGDIMSPDINIVMTGPGVLSTEDVNAISTRQYP